MALNWVSVCAFDVQGEPKAQPRVKAFYNKNIKRARVYTPGTAEEWKSFIAIAARPYLPEVPLTGAVKLNACFLFKRPQRLMKKGSPEGLVPHTQKPDRDNLDKAVLDALTHIGMFSDDCIVCDGEIKKYFVAKTGRPGAAIQIFKLEE